MSPFFIVVPLLVLMAPAEKPQQKTERVVLLPNADGSPSGVFIKSDKGEALIDKPYLGATVSASGIAPHAEEPSAVQARYRTTLDALPEPANGYSVYFEQASARMTPPSAERMLDLRRTIARRSVPEVTIVAHADRADAPGAASELTAARADAVRRILVAAGVDDAHITTVARGSEDQPRAKRGSDPQPMERRADIHVR